MKLLRRSFFQSVAGLGALPGTHALFGCSDGNVQSKRASEILATGAPFADLVADPNGILDLPEAYSYVILERAGDKMSDGHQVPERPDGMACFESKDGDWILMRNHELDLGACPIPEKAFNGNMTGGVTRLLLDQETLEKKTSNYVLVGTNRNCAGGPSPWGWLSCEETEDPGHGYVFVCNPDASKAEKPQRAASLGRFKHEAAAVDPETEIIYLTEDKTKSALYRHVPKDGPFVGALSAMKVKGETRYEFSSNAEVGDTWEIEWVEIDDVLAESVSTSEQAFKSGAAVVTRGEGCWFYQGALFFVSTSGGPDGLGQIFRLDPTSQGGSLTLIAQASGEGDLVNPDNMTVSPHGELFVVEDNDGPNRIHRINPNGSVETLARNVLDDGVSELCGVCFSPDGSVMFVNLQEPGLTLAIRGPFGES